MITKIYLVVFTSVVLSVTIWSTSISSIVIAQSIDDLIIMTENYPPFNFEENKKLKGIAVDLMILILKKLDSQQTRDDIQLLPWARGYRFVLKKKNTSLFSMTRTEKREKLFKWVGPISPTTIALIARKDKNIKITSIMDVKQYKVGVVRNDIGEQLLVSAGIELKQLDRVSGISATVKSLKKLDKGKIDIWSYEKNVAYWEIKSQGLNPAEYEVIYTLKEAELYYAFNKETSDMLIQRIQQALDELKDQGDYHKILDRYLK